MVKVTQLLADQGPQYHRKKLACKFQLVALAEVVMTEIVELTERAVVTETATMIEIVAVTVTAVAVYRS